MCFVRLSKRVMSCPLSFPLFVFNDTFEFYNSMLLVVLVYTYFLFVCVFEVSLTLSTLFLRNSFMRTSYHYYKQTYLQTFPIIFSYLSFILSYNLCLCSHFFRVRFCLQTLSNCIFKTATTKTRNLFKTFDFFF